ncbi:MFS transporter [Streptomyces spinosirectus]
MMHLSALRAGLPFVILRLIPLPLAPVLSKVLTRVGPRRLLMGGLLPMAAGQFWIAALPVTTTSLAAFVGPALLLGVGFICVVSSLTSAAVNAVPITMTGMAGGATSLVRELGQALGPAVISTAVISTVVMSAVVMSAASSVLVGRGQRRQRQRQGRRPARPRGGGRGDRAAGVGVTVGHTAAR